ncbi:MAG TPA: hypothetical protein PLO35_08800 [Candidatus Cloacimonadota bacterium]|nr:hypothetical protein [Candidatus Cloacimonadota bacterium]
MKKTIVFVFLFLCGYTFVYTTPVFGEINPDFAFQEADKALPILGLDQFLGMIDEQNFQLYGFSEIGDVRQVKPGLPLQLFTIKPQSILNYTSGATTEELLEPTNQCYIPLLSQGKPQCMVLATIAADGALQVVSLGYAKLADQLYAAFSGADLNPELSRLVVVYQAREFFLSDQSKPDRLYPIQNTYEAGLNADTNVEHNLSRIRAGVEAALQEGR